MHTVHPISLPIADKQDTEETLKVYRKATQKDIDIWTKARDREEPMKVKARQIAIRLELQMKISDNEFQGDGSKATFYYFFSPVEMLSRWFLLFSI